MGKAPKMRQPTAEQKKMDWKSDNPRDLAKEIGTFMNGEWPERRARKVSLSLDAAPTSCEDLMEATRLNPTLLSEMSEPTRALFLEVYVEDIQDVYSEVMETLTPLAEKGGDDESAAATQGRVTWDSVRKFKHLTISIGLHAVSDVCQAAFDHPDTDLDEWPEVVPDHRPGCWCTLDVEKFTELTAASTALFTLLRDAQGVFPEEVSEKIIHTKERFYYEDI